MLCGNSAYVIQFQVYFKYINSVIHGRRALYTLKVAKEYVNSNYTDAHFSFLVMLCALFFIT
jgi:hypothetical protein